MIGMQITQNKEHVGKAFMLGNHILPYTPIQFSV